MNDFGKLLAALKDPATRVAFMAGTAPAGVNMNNIPKPTRDLLSKMSYGELGIIADLNQVNLGSTTLTCSSGIAAV
jgi:hypothetical protein